MNVIGIVYHISTIHIFITFTPCMPSAFKDSNQPGSKVNDMPFQLSNCIENLAKSGRVVIISKSMFSLNDTSRPKRIVPFWQTKLSEYGG